MIAAIEELRPQLGALCRRYQIKRLELFGSAADGRFDPLTSDLDFMYESATDDFNGAADRFFGLLQELEKLFRRRIDLVSAKQLVNPFFFQSACRTKITLYAA